MGSRPSPSRSGRQRLTTLLYTVYMYGRSATDTYDRYQKKIAMAARRTLRNGAKGGLFTVRCSLHEHGKCMWVDFLRDSTPLAKLHKQGLHHGQLMPKLGSCADGQDPLSIVSQRIQTPP